MYINFSRSFFEYHLGISYEIAHWKITPQPRIIYTVSYDRNIFQNIPYQSLQTIQVENDFNKFE